MFAKSIAVLFCGCLALTAAEPKQESSSSAKNIPSAKSIQKWIAELGADDYAVREAAGKALVEASPYSAHAVWDATKSTDLEVSRRAMELVPIIEARCEKALEDLGVSVQRMNDEKKVVRTVSTMYKETTHRLTDEALVYLYGFPYLEGLSLVKTTITNEGLITIGKLRTLQILHLEDTNINDDGLGHLNGMATLKDLYIGKAEVNGRGLAKLYDFPNLEAMTLFKVPITDQGIASGIVGLNKLTKMTKLTIGSLQISDEGVKAVSSLNNLVEFRLCFSIQITDNCISHLQAMNKLESLDIRETQITTKCAVDFLKNMPQMRYVNLRDGKAIYRKDLPTSPETDTHKNK